MTSSSVSFRLNEFQQIARWLDKRFPTPIAFVLKGYLYALETRYIDVKVVAEVNRAIAAYKPLEEPLRGPTFTTKPSEVEGLDIIRLTNENVSPLRDREDPR